MLPESQGIKIPREVLQMKGRSWLWACIMGVVLLFALSPPLRAIENSACLDCHGDPDMVKELPNGKAVSLYVNPDRFKASVHGRNGIGCTDCHSDIEKLNYEKEVPHPVPVAPVNCADCHDEESAAYEESVHAKAKAKGIKGAPTCATCHQYHYTPYLAAYTVKEKRDLFCSKCHDPMSHHKWLTQKETHFAHVDCSLCHAKTKGMTNLRLYNPLTMKFIPGGRIIKAFGGSYDSFLKSLDANKNHQLENEELKAVSDKLGKKGFRVALYGEMVAESTPEVHKITKNAIRKCDTCHSPKSPYLRSVSFVLTKPDGEISSYKVEKASLSSFTTSKFYLLSATKVKWVDIIGFILILAGLCFAGGHFFIRIVTIPIRRKRGDK